MNKLDDILDELRAKPPHSALTEIDATVFAGMARRRDQQASRRGMLLAGVIAVTIGAAGGVIPSSSANAEPLFGIPAEAPSHLLAD